MTRTAFSRFTLEGKVAVVTGGGDGIGRATAGHLAWAGAAVAVLDIDAGKATATANGLAETGAFATAYAVDVSDEAQLRAAMDAVVAAHGRLDVLVNNAGIAIRGPALGMSIEDWNRVIGVNLTGMFLAARVAASHMIAGGHGGAIVNIASIMGLSGGLYPNAAYQTSKGGVVNMTRALALEWAAAGIRVNAIAPTFTRTALVGALTSNPETLAAIQAATPLGRLAEPEEIADAILFLAAPCAAMITGAILPVDGGYLAR